MEDNLEVRDLIIMEHYGIISAEDKARLELILASDGEARALQAEIKASIPKEKAHAFMEEIDVSKANALVFAKEEHRIRMVHKKQRRSQWLAVAAVLAGGILAGFYFFDSSNRNEQVLASSDKNSGILLQLASGETITLKDSGEQTINRDQVQLNNTNRVLQFNHLGGTASGWNTLIVPSRLDYKVELSDGSIIWLNSTSSIRFPFAFSGSQREIYLEGEAFFEVASDPHRPFIVHSNGCDIQVLGTSFNVNAYFAGKVSTALVNGKVAVIKGDERIELQPGKEVIVRAGSKTKIQEFDPQITLGWKQGIHYFQDASMLEIAEMVPRWFNEKIIIDDAKAKQATFRIKIYRHQPIKQFIDQINNTGVVSLYYQDGRLHCKSL